MATQKGARKGSARRSKPHHLSDVQLEWLEAMAAERVAPETLTAYRRDTDRAIVWLAGHGVVHMEQLTTARLQAFLDAQGTRRSERTGEAIHPRTLRRYAATLRTWCAWLARYGPVHGWANPAAELRAPENSRLPPPVKWRRARPEWLTMLARQHRPVDYRNRALVALLLDGWTPRELAALTMAQLSTDYGTVYIEVPDDAGVLRSRDRQLSPTAKAALKEYIPERRAYLGVPHYQDAVFINIAKGRHARRAMSQRGVMSAMRVVRRAARRTEGHKKE